MMTFLISKHFPQANRSASHLPQHANTTTLQGLASSTLYLGFATKSGKKKYGADGKAAHTCLTLPSKLPAELCNTRNLFSLCTMPWFLLKVSSSMPSPCSRVVRISCFSWAISSSNNRFSSLLSFSCFSSSSFFLSLSSNSELEGEIVKERDNYTHPRETTLWGGKTWNTRVQWNAQGNTQASREAPKGISSWV